MTLMGILAAIVTIALFSLFGPEESIEARALVAVQESSFSLDELPAALAAIQDAGVVEAQAVQQNDLGVTAETLASHSTIVVIKGTPIIQVTGIDASADNAARYSNSLAESLTEVLNRSRALGVFELIEPATAERSEPSPTLPVWPLAIFVGVLAGFVTLLAAFVLIDPIHTIGDLANVTEAEIIDEVWLDPHPPIAGKIRSAAARLHEREGSLRLIHAGWGEDMTDALDHLLAKFASSTDGGDLAAELATQNVVVVMEGTPMRKLLDLEASLRTFPDAVILVHPRLA